MVYSKIALGIFSLSALLWADQESATLSSAAPLAIERSAPWIQDESKHCINLSGADAKLLVQGKLRGDYYISGFIHFQDSKGKAGLEFHPDTWNEAPQKLWIHPHVQQLELISGPLQKTSTTNLFSLAKNDIFLVEIYTEANAIRIHLNGNELLPFGTFALSRGGWQIALIAEGKEGTVCFNGWTIQNTAPTRAPLEIIE